MNRLTPRTGWAVSSSSAAATPPSQAGALVERRGVTRRGASGPVLREASTTGWCSDRRTSETHPCACQEQPGTRATSVAVRDEQHAGCGQCGGWPWLNALQRCGVGACRRVSRKSDPDRAGRVFQRGSSRAGSRRGWLRRESSGYPRLHGRRSRVGALAWEKIRAWTESRRSPAAASAAMKASSTLSRCSYCLQHETGSSWD
jgi:hypothetical protein